MRSKFAAAPFESSQPTAIISYSANHAGSNIASCRTSTCPNLIINIYGPSLVLNSTLVSLTALYLCVVYRPNRVSLNHDDAYEGLYRIRSYRLKSQSQILLQSLQTVKARTKFERFAHENTWGSRESF